MLARPSRCPAVVVFGILVAMFAMEAAPGAASDVGRGMVDTHPAMRPPPSPSNRPLAEGRSFWVDSGDGSDRADGGIDSPWKTIAHALGRLEPGDTLVLRAGVYWERLIVDIEGAPSRPITIRSHPGELAILDGGIKALLEDPEGSWEPVPDGAPDEFRSVRPWMGRAEAQGWFAETMVPIQAYRKLEDLRATNENWVDHDVPRYCGPGIWYDTKSGRLHIRMSHVGLAALPAESRYRGETDPRKVPLIVGGGKGVPLWIEGGRHLKFQDLVVRGGGSTTVRLLGATDIELDNVTVYSGRHAFYMDRSRSVRIVRSAFRGTAAPWSFRSGQKYRGVPSILFRTGAAWHKSRDLEVAWSELTDGHDGVFLGEVDQVRFHHNLVDNFNDDGLFLTSRTTGPADVRIYQNRISRCLTCLAFGWGRGDSNKPGPGVSIYRNLVELLEPVHYFPPRPEEPQVLNASGRVTADHGSPIWEPLLIYHNTFVAKAGGRAVWGLGWGGHLQGTSRQVFNNIFVQVEDMPDRHLPLAVREFRADGNLHWSVDLGAAIEGEFYGPIFALETYEATRLDYPPGWEAGAMFADPRFVRFDRRGGNGNDYRLQPGSPAIDAGVELPEDWPDPLRAADAGAPDIGALPLGTLPLNTLPLNTMAGTGVAERP